MFSEFQAWDCFSCSLSTHRPAGGSANRLLSAASRLPLSLSMRVCWNAATPTCSLPRHFTTRGQRGAVATAASGGCGPLWKRSARLCVGGLAQTQGCASRPCHLPRGCPPPSPRLGFQRPGPRLRPADWQAHRFVTSKTDVLISTRPHLLLRSPCLWKMFLFVQFLCQNL